MRRITPERVLEVANAIINGVEFGFLITRSESGEANARIMHPFAPEQDLAIWFGTSQESRKMREIQRDNRVTLAFYDSKETAYTTLIGTALVERDVDTRRKYWREEWLAFFPEGPEGEDYVLVKFIPSRIEVMSFAHGILPKPYRLRPAVLVRSGDSWITEKRQG
ncbi:MAG: pyridoxamine 5'-phosphate oxidase family protein [Deltaproteobacteria bacterium]|nr:MAG: pyridoxamine 5'-phosphate oxidase family protein [Deltaproteobacteria bacterium]